MDQTNLLAQFLEAQRKDKFLADQKQLAAEKQAGEAKIGKAGIEAAGTLFTGLLQNAANRAAQERALASQAEQQATESQIKGIQTAQEGQKNALAQLMSNFRSLM